LANPLSSTNTNRRKKTMIEYKLETLTPPADSAPAVRNSTTENPVDKSTIVVATPRLNAPQNGSARISPKSGREDNPALSNRVGEHLINNPRL